MSEDIADVELPEIEITPEMVEAGAGSIWASLSDVIPYGQSSARVLAAEVYEAMRAVRPTKG